MENLKSFRNNLENHFKALYYDFRHRCTLKNKDVCIVIPEEYKIDSSEIKIGEIVGGRYVVFEVEHTMAAVQKAWIDIFQEIPKTGYRLDESRPIIERYQIKMVNNHLCEICIPIY